MASQFPSLLLLALLFSLVSSELVLEDGYTVTTVIDGHKLEINPYSVVAAPGSSDLIVLDSSRSLFYSLSLPLSEESVVQRLAGDGRAGYSDGEPGSAQFKKPKNFAVDMTGNIYVADKSNQVIRKITNSGVTTIAGGKEGRADGPAHNASFSNDFELTFVPHICALLISDHGNQLIRQINLKSEDCSRSSQSGSVQAAVSIWVLCSVLSSLFGLVIGFVARPYVIRHTGSPQTPIQRDMEALPNQSGETSMDLLLRHQKQSRPPKKDFASLLDSDDMSDCVTKSQSYADQLKDLISFDENQYKFTEDILEHGLENQENSDVLPISQGILDDMIQTNIQGFAGETREITTPECGSFVGNSGLVKRCK